jgi:hypothetical protein
VKFGSYGEQEMARNLPNRLKGTNFGISPHYPLYRETDTVLQTTLKLQKL